MKKKKISILFLATLFLLCADVFAQDCGHEGNFEQLHWCFKDGTLTISGNGQMPLSFYPWSFLRDSITNIFVGNGVTSIGNAAFYAYTALVSVEMPSVVSIRNYAFCSCPVLVSVEMPSVTSIGNYSFSHCFALVSVELPSSLVEIGESAFYSSALSSVTIPHFVSIIKTLAFGNCSNLTSINVDSNNAHYTSVNGILFDKLKTRLIQFPAGLGQTHNAIPNSVTTIGNYAFEGCVHLTSITFPNNITSIGIAPFYYCTNLEYICSHNENPPEAYNLYTFGGGVNSCTLYVNLGCGYSYEHADGWHEFENIVESISISGNVNHDGIPLAGVMMHTTSGMQGVTNIEGDYAVILSGNDSHSLTITPNLSDYAFYPNDISYFNLVVSLNEQNYTANMPPKITTEYLPNGTINETYSIKIAAEGYQPIIWSLFDGDLPNDLSINSYTGEIVGIPVENGRFYFSIMASNEFGDDLSEFIIEIKDVGIDIVYTSELHIFPNPSSERFIVITSHLFDESIELFDINGLLVHIQPRTIYLETLEIDISHLSDGIYFLKVGNEIVKIVKQ